MRNLCENLFFVRLIFLKKVLNVPPHPSKLLIVRVYIAFSLIQIIGRILFSHWNEPQWNQWHLTMINTSHTIIPLQMESNRPICWFIALPFYKEFHALWRWWCVEDHLHHFDAQNKSKIKTQFAKYRYIRVYGEAKWSMTTYRTFWNFVESGWESGNAMQCDMLSKRIWYGVSKRTHT